MSKLNAGFSLNISKKTYNNYKLDLKFFNFLFSLSSYLTFLIDIYQFKQSLNYFMYNKR